MGYFNESIQLEPSGRTDESLTSVAQQLRSLADSIEAGNDHERVPADPILSLKGRSAACETLALPMVRPESVQQIMELRDRRRQFFGEELFGEPAWDMLLDLFHARLTDKRISVTSLSIASNAPLTTALRHIDRLIAAGVVIKTDDPADGRRSMVTLSRDAYRKMSHLLA